MSDALAATWVFVPLIARSLNLPPVVTNFPYTTRYWSDTPAPPDPHASGDDAANSTLFVFANDEYETPDATNAAFHSNAHTFGSSEVLYPSADCNPVASAFDAAAAVVKHVTVPD